jgi:membrane associated rhomboid family serine protease
VQIFGGSAQGPYDTVAVPESVTLLSYMFLHGDIFHLLSNMLFLWVFGDNVEDAMGHTKFLVFFLLCGLAGGLAHAAMQPASKLPLIGASGAVAGVIGAYLLLHPRVLVWVLAFRFIPLKIPAALVLGVWVATQVIMVFVTQAGPEQVAWWAHIGGFLAGAVLIVLFRRPGVPLLDRGLHRSTTL